MLPELSAEFETYLLCELNRAPLTVEAYCRDIMQLAEWLTDGNPDAFDPLETTSADIRAWLASMTRSNLSQTSVRRKAQSIRAFYRFLVKTGKTESNPMGGLRLPKIPKHLPDPVRADELDRILARQSDEGTPGNESDFMDDLILDLLYSLGLRRAELIGINDSDISPFAAEITITGKRSKQRVIPLPQRLLGKIAAWQQLRDSSWSSVEEPRPLITVKGKRISPRQVYDSVRRSLGGTSARKKSPHALRHSFATEMLNNGASLDSVKEFLGHASLATTQIYTHISFAETSKAYLKAHPRAKNGNPSPEE